jgi:hypothetical protein
MEHWVISKSTDEAAAFATLGMPIRVLRGMDTKQGKESVHFGIGMMNLEGTEKTKAIQGAFKSGKLARTPWHPYLVIRLAFENRNKILDLANRGELIRLKGGVLAPGAYAKSDEGLMGLETAAKKGIPLLKTGDLKMVAALSVCGLPILHIEGTPGHRVFYVMAVGYSRDRLPVDGGALMKAWREDPASVPWESPFAQAMRGLTTRERVLDAIHNANIAITVMQPRNIKSAIVTADSQGNVSDEAMRKVAEFFHG